MAIIDDIKRVMGTNKNDTPDETNKKTSKSTDDIKSVINSENGIYDFMFDDDFTKVKHEVYEEQHQFYNHNMRTNFLKTTFKKVRARVLDDIKLQEVKFRQEQDENKVWQDVYDYEDIENVNIDDINIGINDFGRMFDKALLNDSLNVKVDYDEDGNIEFHTLMDYEFEKSKDKVIFKDIKGKKYDKEIRYLNKTEYYKTNAMNNDKLISVDNHKRNSLMFYSVPLNLDYITKGIIEKILKYSELENSIQKEIKLSAIQLFIDNQYLKGYDDMREHFTPVQTPDTYSADDGSKPLFEFVNPTLRAYQYIKYEEIIQDDLSNDLLLDSMFLGFQNVTATAASITNSQTVDTINMLKRTFEEAINKLLEQMFNTQKYKLVINDYVVKDVDKEIERIIKLKQAGIITTLSGVKMTNDVLNIQATDEDVKKEAYKIMYEEGIPFTQEEQDEAKELGVLFDTNLEGLEDGTVL